MFSQLVAGISATLASIGAWQTSVEIGDEFQQEVSGAPRYVMVPSSESYKPVTGPGGNPRPLWDRHIEADVFIWGTTRDNTEGMIDQFLISLHRTIKGTTPGGGTSYVRGGSYGVLGGKWIRRTNLMKYGFAYVLRVAIVVPVIDRDWTGTPAQPPDQTTYTGTQILTNQDIPPDTHAVADVAAQITPTPAAASGDQSVNVPKP